MIDAKTEVYYTASVKLHRVESVYGGVLTEDDATGWLCEDYGYLQVHSYPRTKWAEEGLARLKDYMKWDGIPWYRQIKPGSLRIFKHTVTTVTQEEEVHL